MCARQWVVGRCAEAMHRVRTVHIGALFRPRAKQGEACPLERILKKAVKNRSPRVSGTRKLRKRLGTRLHFVHEHGLAENVDVHRP